MHRLQMTSDVAAATGVTPNVGSPRTYKLTVPCKDGNALCDMKSAAKQFQLGCMKVAIFLQYFCIHLDAVATNFAKYLHYDQ